MYIVDENGIVQAKFFKEDHRERYTTSHVLVRHFPNEAIERLFDGSLTLN